MTFRTDDGQTAGSFYFRAQLDVGTTACHIRSDGNRTAQTGFGYDVRLSLVQFGVQYVVFDLAHGKHLAQHFRNFYGSGTYQYRASGLNQLLDLFDNGFVFFAFGFVNAVIHIFTGDRTVGGDYHHIQFVDVPKFACFRFGSTGHTGQLMIHTEVILQGNRCKSLCGSFHFHTFFRFNSLVQSVRVAAAFHDTAGLFINDFHLSVYNDIFIVFFEHGVCFQQLVDGMYTFGFDGIIGKQGIFLFQLLFVAQIFFIFQFGELCCDIRQDE